MIKKTIEFVPTGTTGFTGYNFDISLSVEDLDFGCFDSYTGVTSSPITGTSNTITGTSSSRLSELRKYTVSGTLSDLYFVSTGSTSDGLILSSCVTGTTASTYVYLIGGISYMDVIIGSATTTTFSCTTSGLTDPNNFTNYPIIKLDSKENMVLNPFIQSDVFIIRQEIPVFEPCMRLRGVGGLNDVLTYAGGNYFTIINNT